MSDFDWTKFNAENNELHFTQHDPETHNRAHASPYNAVFQLAMARFDENFRAFIHFYDDKDPLAEANWIHLFESAVVHALNTLIQEAHENGKEFDEVAAAFSMAGFGFILGRTFQEFEAKRLMANGDLHAVGQTITTAHGSTEV